MDVTTITVTCCICRKEIKVTVPVEGYKRWASRQCLIQDAMPELSADERELLMSNICPECFDRLFAEK